MKIDASMTTAPWHQGLVCFQVPRPGQTAPSKRPLSGCPAILLVGYPGKLGCFTAEETGGRILIGLCGEDPKEVNEGREMPGAWVTTEARDGWGDVALAALRQYLGRGDMSPRDVQENFMEERHMSTPEKELGRKGAPYTLFFSLQPKAPGSILVAQGEDNNPHELD